MQSEPFSNEQLRQLDNYLWKYSEYIDLRSEISESFKKQIIALRQDKPDASFTKLIWEVSAAEENTYIQEIKDKKKKLYKYWCIALLKGILTKIRKGYILVPIISYFIFPHANKWTGLLIIISIVAIYIVFNKDKINALRQKKEANYAFIQTFNHTSNITIVLLNGFVIGGFDNYNYVISLTFLTGVLVLKPRFDDLWADYLKAYPDHKEILEEYLIEQKSKK